MKDADKIKDMKKQIEELRPCLLPSGQINEAVHKSLCLLVDYIEFMITPCEDDD